jgi:very-short-patch-repair endonuclease
MTKLELEFAALWEHLYPDIDLISQYPIKRYRIDFCHPVAKIAVECQGGTWVTGMGHSSGKGIKRDCEKFCYLASLGYLIFPLTCDMIDEKYLVMIASSIEHLVATNILQPQTAHNFGGFSLP